MNYQRAIINLDELWIFPMALSNPAFLVYNKP